MTTEKSSKKRKKPNIILDEKTSLFIFFYPILFSLCLIYYTFHTKTNLFIFLAGSIIFIGLQYYFMVFGKKIILTDKKIYVYSRDKKVLSWELIGDFAYINYSQERLGRWFNYGSLIIVNQKKESYVYHFLNNPKSVYEKVIQQYEELMINIDPTYEKQFAIKESKLDSIEPIKHEENT